MARTQDSFCSCPELNRILEDYSSFLAVFEKVPPVQLQSWFSDKPNIQRVLPEFSSAVYLDDLPLALGLLAAQNNYEFRLKPEKLSTLANLAAPSSLLLRKGSDDRSQICPETKTTKYHTQYRGRSEQDCIQRGSCTCNSPSLDQITKADQIRMKWVRKLLAQDLKPTNLYQQQMDRLRSQLSRTFNLDHETSFIICTPSGTDAELFATLLSFKPSVSKVVNIVTSAGEVGSGTENAATFRYFAPVVPASSHKKAQVGSSLNRSATVETIALSAREDCQTVKAKISDILESEKDSAVLLHLVQFSKTGLQSFDFEFAVELKAKYNNLMIIVDACQLRCNNDNLIRDSINNGFVVLTTLSKFASAPSYCGAVIFPKSEIDKSHWLDPTRAQQEQFPTDLGDFVSLYDVDPRLHYLKDNLPDWTNWGLLLRFKVGLSGYRRLMKFPFEKREAAVQTWYSNILQEFAAFPNLEVQPLNRSQYLDVSVVSFSVKSPEHQTTYKMDELKKIHYWMTLDLTQRSFIDLTENFKTDIAKQSAYLGQPVQTDQSHNGVLRIALGSNQLIKIIEEGITESTSQEKMILEKLTLITHLMDVKSLLD